VADDFKANLINYFRIKELVSVGYKLSKTQEAFLLRGQSAVGVWLQ